MAKLSLDELRSLRQVEGERLKRRKTSSVNGHVAVSMGTCGIKAGAKIVLDAIVDELDAKGFEDVVVTQTGCVGSCKDEPIVEVYTPALGRVAYGKVDVKLAKAIVNDHIIGNKILEDHKIDLEV